MKDNCGRQIDYMRVSITDRCDLRCGYCMPYPVESIPHTEILRYEEILRLCGAAIKLGITNYKVTGGEPFVRPGAESFIRSLKALPGVNTVTVTTNGMQNNIDKLEVIPIDGINISLDATDPKLFKSITKTGDVTRTLNTINSAAKSGIPVKLNTVLLNENRDEWLKIIGFAQDAGVTARFIELMPLGSAAAMSGPKAGELMRAVESKYGTLAPTADKYGNGPAKYFTAPGLKQKIGVIGATTRSFCDECNRVRLTAEGILTPCLCHGGGTDLKALLRSGASDAEISEAIKSTVEGKPARHNFDAVSPTSKQRTMNRIGG